ncbi:MAG: Sir2 family NAD-dependent protein deacetylase [Candidatus Omnitrophota bacterium]|nr:Sir2 family NAD-dependent protein deacetylase [Candidatus Omnitrophota bacterium]MDZ4242588.1 Sir2 family NAD-dependent protein deacetylase [Candidatus Omnitrophota bacterium]
MHAIPEQCATLINEAQNISVLTGAGISTNAGIPDFRGPKGLYVTRQYDPDRVFDIEYFLQDPYPFYEFARDFIGLEQTIKPTFTHKFLAALENAGRLRGIVTQNIDSLHQKAGSEHVYEMHGSFWKSHCLECGQAFTYSWMKGALKNPGTPRCVCGGLIKPDIVFFGENVKHLPEASQLAHESDLFLVIGSSCVVYPAAMVPTLANGKIVIINKGAVHLDCYNISLTVDEDADAFLKQVAASLKIKVAP